MLEKILKLTQLGGWRAHAPATVWAVERAVQEIQLVYQYLRAFNSTTSRRAVILDLGFVSGSPVFSEGLVFQAYSGAGGSVGSVEGLANQGGQGSSEVMDVLALGGRYDKLITTFRPPLSRKVPLAAIGVNFAVDKLVAHVLRGSLVKTGGYGSSGSGRSSGQRSGYGSGTNRADPGSGVLVFAADSSMFEERAKLAGLLWQVGIRAEIMYPLSLDWDQVPAFCEERALRFAVMLQKKNKKALLIDLEAPTHSRKPQVELKNLVATLLNVGAAGTHTEHHSKSSSKSTKGRQSSDVLKDTSKNFKQQRGKGFAGLDSREIHAKVKVIDSERKRKSAEATERLVQKVMAAVGPLLTTESQVEYKCLVLNLTYETIRAVTQTIMSKDKKEWDSFVNSQPQKYRYTVQMAYDTVMGGSDKSHRRTGSAPDRPRTPQFQPRGVPGRSEREREQRNAQRSSQAWIVFSIKDERFDFLWL